MQHAFTRYLQPKFVNVCLQSAGQWQNAPASVRSGQTAQPMLMQLLPAVMPMSLAAREALPSGDLRLQ